MIIEKTFKVVYEQKDGLNLTAKDIRTALNFYYLSRGISFHISENGDSTIIAQKEDFNLTGLCDINDGCLPDFCFVGESQV